MKLIKISILIIIFVLPGKSLLADWDPDCINEPKTKLHILENPNFQKMENDVFQYLKTSWCSQEKAKMLIELITLVQPKVCVEIGTFSGSTALPVLVALQYLGSGHAYLIDAWSNSEAVKNLDPNDPNTIWWSKVDFGHAKNELTRMIKKWSLNTICTLMHITSEQAACRFNYIDFLHLDGNFSEQGALLDTQIYLPKVKSGGYILLSNAFMMINHKPTKQKALWPLFDECEIVCEIENSNAILFKKK